MLASIRSVATKTTGDNERHRIRHRRRILPANRLAMADADPHSEISRSPLERIGEVGAGNLCLGALDPLLVKL